MDKDNRLNCFSKKQDFRRVGSRVYIEKAKKASLNGMDVLQLYPYPNAKIPREILDRVKNEIFTQMNAPSDGILAFRKTISRELKKELGLEYGAKDHIVVTNGAMHGLTLAVGAVIDPGDEILLFSPCYFFDGIIELWGGIPVMVPLEEEKNYAYDFDRLEAAITEKTKAVIINNPNNPTGYLATKSDLERLAAIEKKYDLFVISDDSYNKMIFDGETNYNIACEPDMQERAILVRSFTKTYGMPGWRVGYCASNQKIKAVMKTIMEWMCLYGNYFAQLLAKEVMEHPTDWVDKETASFEMNIRKVCAYLETSKLLSCILPKGGPFLYINTQKAIDLPSEEISDLLLEKFGISTTPGAYHYEEGHVRIPLGGSEKTIDRLIQRLEEFQEYCKKERARK